MEKFEKENIIPDVVDNLPKQILEVNWEKEKADLGNVVTPTDMKDEPNISWKAEKNTYYTLIMTAPDAPSRIREFNHWLVVNIPGSQVNQGEVKTEYMGAAPPQETGVHRYVFLVFKQPSKLSFDQVHFLPNTTRKHRENFDTRAFMHHHKLEELTAANFVKARYDLYVPALNQELAEN